MVVPETDGSASTDHGVLAAHLPVVHHRHLAIPIVQEDGTKVHAQGTDIGAGNFVASLLVIFC